MDFGGKDMFIADAHCDTLYAIALNGCAPENCTVTPERLAAGGVGLQTYAMFTGSNGVKGIGSPDPRFEADKSAPHIATPYEDGVAMLKESYNLPIEVLRGPLPELPPQNPTAILSVEGGEMLEGSLDRLAEFDDDTRLRMIALTWNHENEIGYPAKSGSTLGLKPFGISLLKEMDRRGILADVSHLNDAGFWDVCEHASLPPIATHSDCRWLCNSFRNLTKDMVKAIIDRKGFIGINFYSCFLREDGNATLDDVVRHIDAMMELGAEDVLGFGSDFDGIELWPEGLADPSDFPALIDLLRRHGYSETQLEKIAGLNLWRVLKDADNRRCV